MRSPTRVIAALLAASCACACADRRPGSDVVSIRPVGCAVTVSPPALGLVEVQVHWICPDGRLASGNWVVSLARDELVEIGGLYACGSTSVAFVPSSDFAISASGDVSAGGEGPVPCDTRGPEAQRGR